MPELPDVEVFRQYLSATALHKTISRTRVQSREVLQGISPAGMGRKLKGRRFADTRRHGKHLFVAIEEDGWLHLHFGMTGFLKYHKDPETGSAHPRVRFLFENGYRLDFDNQRMLGEVGIVDDVDRAVERMELGPDALDISSATFIHRYEDRRGGIKSALMNQEAMAGIGNIYADEVLFQAGIHPLDRVRDLGAEVLNDLHGAMRRVLKTAIDRQADPDEFPDAFIIPRRKAGATCPRCKETIKKIKVNGRGTFVCTACQPPPG